MILFLDKDPLEAALKVKIIDQEKVLNHYLQYLLGSSEEDTYKDWINKKQSNYLWLLFKCHYLLGKIEQRGIKKPLQIEIIDYLLNQKYEFGTISKIPNLKFKTLANYEKINKYRLLYMDYSM